jgi:hypothetical protein
MRFTRVLDGLTTQEGRGPWEMPFRDGKRGLSVFDRGHNVFACRGVILGVVQPGSVGGDDEPADRSRHLRHPLVIGDDLSY